jgi:hypothetical protein
MHTFRKPLQPIYRIFRGNETEYGIQGSFHGASQKVNDTRDQTCTQLARFLLSGITVLKPTSNLSLRFWMVEECFKALGLQPWKSERHGSGQSR